MSEIEITLPTVQFGNVKVRATPEELGVDIASPAAVGTATAIYLNLFTQGFKVGASMDVIASPTEGLSAPQGAEQSEVKEVFAGAVATAQEEAQRLLSEGLGGVTEVRSVEQIMSDEDVDTIDQARKIQEQEVSAPWDRRVDAKPKPWETESKLVQSVSELISDEW